jgi:hypothetical protein
VTFNDEVLFDAHRLTGICVPPRHLDLIAVGEVWCRLLAGQHSDWSSPSVTSGRASGPPR